MAIYSSSRVVCCLKNKHNYLHEDTAKRFPNFKFEHYSSIRKRFCHFVLECFEYARTHDISRHVRESESGKAAEPESPDIRASFSEFARTSQAFLVLDENKRRKQVSSTEFRVVLMRNPSVYSFHGTERTSKKQIRGM